MTAGFEKPIRSNRKTQHREFAKQEQKTAMNAHRIWSVSLALSGCVLFGYVVLSIGLVDDVLIARNHSAMLRRVKAASESDPPDIEVLTKALRGTDWFVAAAAAERIGQIRQSGDLEPEQTDVAVQALFEALAAGGHWWRFGWDMEEPEFAQFQGAAIEATARFGLEALPALATATDGNSPFEREAACWITLSMLKSGSVDRTTLVERDILERIEGLALNDPDERVKTACASVHRAIADSPGP